VPTRAGIATVVCAVLCLAAGRVFGIFELYIVAAVMIALVGCSIVWVLLNWRSLAVTRLVAPARLHAGGTSTVTLELANRRIIPTPVARITDEVQGTVRADAQVPPIRRNRTTRASYRVPTDRRGLIAIGPMTTRVTDPFGLASSRRTSAPDTSLLVLPRVDRIAAPPQPGGDAAMRLDRTPNRVGPSGDEFSSLRAYVVGDDLRKVHWPTTARTGELVVRNENVPEHGHSLVVLDVRALAADSPTFERMVSAAASVVVACHERGDKVRLAATDGTDIRADTAKGFNEALDALALIQQTPYPTISLPVRVGRAGAEAGVMIVAGDSEALLSTITSGGSGPQSTFIVRFHGAAGARMPTDSSRLRSRRMIEVHADDDFAAMWDRIAGLASARAL
jgi:uncharacterized protein (DUF58 family)